jgi:ABC-type sugar transport system substrate-binding protein
MSQHHDNREAALSRRHALAWIMATGTTALYALSDGAGEQFSLFDQAEAAAIAHDKPVIPVIVKDTTSFYWQTVIAGARKAGQDLGIKIVELGAQSDSDASGQISLLEIAVASSPTALVLAPAQFAALRRPIDEAAKKVKIIGIDSDADSAAFTSMVATDNVRAGRIAADILADRIKRTYADAEGDVALITSSLESSRSISVPRDSRSKSRQNTAPWTSSPRRSPKITRQLGKSWQSS